MVTEKKKSKDEILKAIENMSLSVSGISKSVARVVNSGEVQIADISENDASRYEVILNAIDNKVAAIKVVRTLTGLGLKESKDAIERLPFTVLSGVTKKEALGAVSALEEVGGQSFISGMPPLRRIRLRRKEKEFSRAFVVPKEESVFETQLQKAVSWLYGYLESVKSDTEVDDRQHQEYADAFESTIAEIVQLRKEAVR